MISNEHTPHPQGYGLAKIHCPATAALAVKRFLKLDTVIPCHYGSFPIIEANPDKFVAEMKGHATKVLVPEKGKAVSL
jgi:L-ascorbate metabolism protein UlaG (beta-lactamase superfamily)